MNDQTFFVEYMKNVDSSITLREHLREYFLNYHASKLPLDTNACEAEIKEGLDAFLSDEKEIPSYLSSPVIEEVLSAAKRGSLRDTLCLAIMKTSMTQLPSNNSHYKQIIEKAIETYKQVWEKE